MTFGIETIIGISLGLGVCLASAYALLVLFLIRRQEAIRYSRFITDNNLDAKYNQWESIYLTEKRKRQE